jgi:hypothetical protein
MTCSKFINEPDFKFIKKHHPRQPINFIKMVNYHDSPPNRYKK